MSPRLTLARVFAEHDPAAIAWRGECRERSLRRIGVLMPESENNPGIPTPIEPRSIRVRFVPASRYRRVRRVRVDRCVAGADRIVAALARQRRLAAAGGVIEIERVEFVFRRWRDGEVRISPAVGRRQDLAIAP